MAAFIASSIGTPPSPGRSVSRRSSSISGSFSRPTPHDSGPTSSVMPRSSWPAASRRSCGWPSRRIRQSSGSRASGTSSSPSPNATSSMRPGRSAHERVPAAALEPPAESTRPSRRSCAPDRPLPRVALKRAGIDRMGWRLLFALSMIASTALAGLARAVDEGEEPIDERRTILSDWGDLREDLERSGLQLEAAYTLDYMANVRGGLRREDEVLGNLDLVLKIGR